MNDNEDQIPWGIRLVFLLVMLTFIPAAVAVTYVLLGR